MKVPTEFIHKGVKYQIRTMNGIDQCILAGKIAPLVMPVMAVAIRDGALSELDSLDTSTPEGRSALIDIGLGSFERLAKAISQVPPDEMRQIYNECMRHLLRQGGEGLGWQEVFNPMSGMLMYDDIDGLDVMTLSVEVVKDQLGNFMQGVPFGSILGLPR